MTKNKVIKDCFHSPAAIRKPRCHKAEEGWCHSCLEALAVYEDVKALRKLNRRKKNRESAALSRWKKEERFSDMCAENVALTTQWEELAHEFETINDVNKNLHDAIAVKLRTIANFKSNQKLWKMLSRWQYHHPNNSWLILPPLMFLTSLSHSPQNLALLPIAIPQSTNLNFRIKSSKTKITTQTMVREMW